MRKDKIQKVLEEEVADSDILQAYNQYARDNGYQELFPMSELDEFIGDKSYREVKDMMDDDFSENDDYFYISDSTGYYTSTSDIYDVVDLSDLARYMSDNEDACGISEVEDIIDGITETDELKEAFEKLSMKEKREALIDAGYMDEEDDDELVETCVDDYIEGIVNGYYESINDKLKAIHAEYEA